MVARHRKDLDILVKYDGGLITEIREKLTFVYVFWLSGRKKKKEKNVKHGHVLKIG